VLHALRFVGCVGQSPERQLDQAGDGEVPELEGEEVRTDLPKAPVFREALELVGEPANDRLGSRAQKIPAISGERPLSPTTRR
jgi:hypothetical protein